MLVVFIWEYLLFEDENELLHNYDVTQKEMLT